MTTWEIIIEREALLSTGSHGKLLQAFLLLFFHVKKIFERINQIRNKNAVMELITLLYY